MKKKVCKEPANFRLLGTALGPCWPSAAGVVVSITWSRCLTFCGCGCEPHLGATWDSPTSKQNTPFTLNKSSKSTKRIQSLKVNEIYRLWLGN